MGKGDGDKQKQAKPRSAKRGQDATTIVAPAPTKATFVDPQPPDRYNLVFFAAYADKDAVLAATDEAFLRLYHDDFASALDSKTVWASKAPGSRSHCKADLIKQVATLGQIATEIRDFISNNRSKPKKFGTILLAGHGTPEEFALPISIPVKKGGKRLPLPQLEIALRNFSVLQTDPPKEWTFGAKLWTDLHDDLLKLQTELDMLAQWMDAKWTDDQTLMRIWCCNLGKPPKGTGSDPLEVLGTMFFGKNKFNIEAPQNKSGSTYQWYNSAPPQAKDRTKLFRDNKKKDGLWHPDAIAEVESDSALTVYTGPDLADAQQEFINVALRQAPAPGKENKVWIPVYFVDDAKKKPVYPFDWKTFSALWRRVSK